MLISKYNDEKVTANQYAKELIGDRLEELLGGYWSEDLVELDYEKGVLLYNQGVTEKEIQNVDEMLQKRINALIKYLWR